MFFLPKFHLMIPKDDSSSEAVGDDPSNQEELNEGEENTEEESDDNSSEQEESEDLNEEDSKQAKALFKLLKSPDTREYTLRVMAQQAGILGDGNTPATKKEEKAAKKAIKEILDESLGSNYAPILSERLSKAFEKILEQEREDHSEKLASLEQSSLDRELDNAFEKLSRETKGQSRQFERRMNQLAEKVQPAPGVSTLEYLKMLYSIASSEKGASSVRRNIHDQIRRNASDAGGRLHSSGAAGGTGKGLPKDASLRTIIEHAVNSQLKDK